MQKQIKLVASNITLNFSDLTFKFALYTTSSLLNPKSFDFLWAFSNTQQHRIQAVYTLRYLWRFILFFIVVLNDKVNLNGDNKDLVINLPFNFGSFIIFLQTRLEVRSRRTEINLKNNEELIKEGIITYDEKDIEKIIDFIDNHYSAFFKD